MANLCDFVMKIKGSKDNMRKFFNALTQNGNVWMGRGADAYILEESERHMLIDGYCKWSIQSALLDNAVSMQNQKDNGFGRWHEDSDFYNREYITLFDACKKYHVNMEVYSEETGLGFSEHMSYNNGVITSECKEDLIEICVEDYNCKQEAEVELGREISDEEWENEEWLRNGGYEDWDTSIDYPDID